VPPGEDAQIYHLNERWRVGAPSADRVAAGVFLTQFDAYHRSATPEETRLWLPCQPTDWCYHLTDYGRQPRFSGTITNRQLPGLWDPSLAGFVINPVAVRLKCCYSADASTMGRRLGDRRREEGNDGCPGAWCELPRSPFGDGGCKWRADQLDQAMLQQQSLHRRYNELVFDFDAWTAHLPQSVEAIFLLPGSTPKDIRRAYAVHEAFYQDYGLSRDRAPPLVLYDPAGDVERPFRRLMTPPQPLPPPSPLPLPPYSQPSPPQPLAPPAGILHKGLNCFHYHGATELPLSYAATLDACMDDCLTLPGCTAITVPHEGSMACYRRSDVRLAECWRSSAYDTYLLPPMPPPS
jgi:hypothetical protein